MRTFRSRQAPNTNFAAGPSTPVARQAPPPWSMRPTTFRWLAILTTVFVYAQISLGAAVRVSGSGLGCGNDWPLCRGRILPPANTHAIVEYAHRTVGSITGALLIGAVLVGWLTFRHRQPLIVRLVASATGLIVLEGLLGALVVFKDLSGALVLAHLAVALALMGLLIGASILAVPGSGNPTSRTFRKLTLLAAALTYILLLTGAGVVATGADEVCKSWPFCNRGLGSNFDGVVLYATLHRLAAGLVGLFLVWTLCTAVYRWRSVPRLTSAAGATLILLVVQMAIGYPTAVSHNLSLIAGLHVAAATAVWCGVVATAVLSHNPSSIPLSREPSGPVPRV
jgi:heme a synthase